jgi:hypothetical protein
MSPSRKRNPVWFKRVADGNPSFRAQVHTGHTDHVKHLARMQLVMSLNSLLLFCQRAEMIVAFMLLLAFFAGENEPAFPRRRIGFEVFWNSGKLDAVSL